MFREIVKNSSRFRRVVPRFLEFVIFIPEFILKPNEPNYDFKIQAYLLDLDLGSTLF